MQGTQLTIWDVFEQTEETRLDRLIKWSFSVLDALDPSRDYQLAFSGGKDSHVLLGIYCNWAELFGKHLNVKVVFADTKLESPSLYKLVDYAEALCKEKKIPFVRVKPKLINDFWVKLVGYGYPVPNHRNRWCTGKLKVEPMTKLKSIPIAGSHYGESKKRDQRLKNCGSSECGIDKIENKIEPLATWTNCDIWDWIILQSDASLYPGVCENLLGLYDIASGDNGSLRMGCFMCPVVKKEHIVKQAQDDIIPAISNEIRELIEELRLAPRILSSRTNKAGATLVDARIVFWEKLQPFLPEMKKYGWIDTEIEQTINELLRKRAYPPTYKPEWIAEQEPIAETWNPKANK